MNYTYLRVKSGRYSVALQEKSIEEFAQKCEICIDKKEVEISPDTKGLEEREKFTDFLHSLEKGDSLFIYDLSILSYKVGEIVKILNCLFNREIELYISKYALKVDINSSSKMVVSLLNDIREVNIKMKKSSKGRPKGSISKSKYDKFRDKIIKMLKEGKNVSEISKILNVSRSSLRDYIASRNLKDLVSKNESVNKEINIFEFQKVECKI